MKRVEGIEGLEWGRYSTNEGVGYGPYYLRDRATIIGSVQQCVGDKSHLWMTWVLPRPNKEKVSCYAWSKERAMYFVESWAKYHYKREA
jgi:hypothetical protein